MTPFMQTFTNGSIRVLEPRKEDIRLLDIAIPLSRICRFNGHTRDFYSVAQHCLHCCELAMEDPTYCASPKLALATLLHDAAEAYVGDMPAPVKQYLPGFVEIEHSILRAIYAAFDIIEFAPPVAYAPCDPVKKDRERHGFAYYTPWDMVMHFDQRILFTEKRDVLNDANREWDIPFSEPADFTIVPTPVHVAQMRFINKVHTLCLDANINVSY